jgi:hypothetical protein
MMRKSTVVWALTLAVLSTVSLRGQSQSPAQAKFKGDPWMGTWKVNLARSKYEPGPAPTSNTIKHEPWEGGLRAITDTLDARGRAGHTEWTGKYDGKEYPIEGGTQSNNLSATRAIKRIDGRTYETVNKAADGKRTIRNRWLVSPDGKTMTQIQTGFNTKGQSIKNTVVWEKQ